MDMNSATRDYPAWFRLPALALFVLLVAMGTLGNIERSGILTSGSTPLAVFRAVGSLMMIGFGILLFWRGRYDRVAFVLGAMVMSAGVPTADAVTMFIHADLSLVTFAMAAIAPTAILLFPLFCVYLTRADTLDRRVLPATRWFVAACIAIVLVAAAVGYSPGLTGMPVPGIIALGVVGVINQVVGYALVVRFYAAARERLKNRIKIVFTAFGIALAAVILFVSGQVPGVSSEYQRFADWTSAALFDYVAPGLLAYAVLRHRLFDFGFVLNRTLVYSSVSLVILVLFGLAEWAVEHLIPKHWHGGSTVLSALIALGLFLIFHRLRDFVERSVEKLLFRAWHAAEERLRSFVASSGFFEEVGTLQDALVEEIGSFLETTEVALFLRESDGVYRRTCGRLAAFPVECVGDDPALARLRSTRAAVSLGSITSRLEAAYAAPMITPGGLSGFVLLARLQEGAWRPDEIALVQWAVQQVGVEIYGLQALATEQRLAKITQENALLKDMLERRTEPA